MGKELNNFEKAILVEIIRANEQKYPLLKNHIPYLRVKNREYTGVGMYINFEYESIEEELIDRRIKHLLLSSGKNLELEGLKYGLTHALNITDGKIDFLELVTVGDETWDGKTDNFRFVAN